MPCTCIQDTIDRLRTRVLEPDMIPAKGAELQDVMCPAVAYIFSKNNCRLTIPFRADWKITAKSGRVTQKEKVVNMMADFCPFCGLPLDGAPAPRRQVVIRDNSEDWQALYIDGKKVDEGHNLRVDEILELLRDVGPFEVTREDVLYSDGMDAFPAELPKNPASPEA